MPPIVFISYSHKDKTWKDRLLEHLGGLEEEGLLQTWNDQNIGAGDEWFEETQDAMNAARVAVFLVSAASLKSKFIRHKEIPHLLDRREKEGMTFFPVILKSCVWDESPWLSRFQVRPRDGKPLADFTGNRRDAELAKIAKEILEIVRNGSQPSVPRKPGAVTRNSTLPSLHQLPAPPADFTGREEDLEVPRSALAQGGTGAIFGLRGLGGVGKTTLALKLAEELTPRYPDAQIYLDLKGVDPQPLTAAQAMAHVIRSFHPEAQIPEDGTALAGLYRSVLFGKCTLLLMDNASKQGQEQVESLIPPTGSLLLVTSRFHFTLPGLVVRDLDEMRKDDARDLLLKMAPRIGNGDDEIAHLCGCLPLALRLAGSTLAERLDLSPSEYARRLREGKEQFGPVEASLNLSYELLNAEQQRLWRMLEVFPGTFDTKAAAAVWELETDQAKEVLWELVRCSLVEWEDKEERYRLHDLTRQFAHRKIEAKEKDTAQRRHAEHYLNVLRDTADLYLKGGDNTPLALRLFDSEWGNIQVGHDWAASSVLDNSIATKFCEYYLNQGRLLLSIRRSIRENIHWIASALSSAQRWRDKAREANYLGALGSAYVALGESRHAIDIHKQQLAITREIGDRNKEGIAMDDLGNAYCSLGDFHSAVEIYQQQLALAERANNRRGEARALRHLGVTYKELGDHYRAIEFYEKWLMIAREIRDQFSECEAFNHMGNIYRIIGDNPRARELYAQSLVIAQETGYRQGEVVALGSLGLTYANLGMRSQAIESLERSLAIAREIGNRPAESSVLGQLGYVYVAFGEPDHAIKLLEQTLTKDQYIGDRLKEAQTFGHMGKIYAELGEYSRAIGLYEKQLAIAREIGDRRAEAIACWDLSLIYERERNLARAADLMQIVVDYSREMSFPDTPQKAAHIQILRARIAEQEFLYGPIHRGIAPLKVGSVR